jgi:hypothetical protein
MPLEYISSQMGRIVLIAIKQNAHNKSVSFRAQFKPRTKKTRHSAGGDFSVAVKPGNNGGRLKDLRF